MHQGRDGAPGTGDPRSLRGRPGSPLAGERPPTSRGTQPRGGARGENSAAPGPRGAEREEEDTMLFINIAIVTIAISHLVAKLV